VQSSACGTTVNAKSIRPNNGTNTALPALVSYMRSGRLSLGKGEGRVRVDSGAWGCKREPLTSVLSPWLKGRGGKDRYVAISTYGTI